MRLKLLCLILIALAVNLSFSLHLTTPLLESITQVTTSHFGTIELSHTEAKSKEYNFVYNPRVDPKTYLADYAQSPRIMKYLPLLNKQGELNPYNNKTDLVRQKYLAKLNYDKVANPNKIKQLNSFLATEMGQSILTYFQDLARGGLNYYKLTPPHFRQWLAIKIIAAKDIKMYARSIAEDIELFKQFYINSRNKKIQQIRGIPQPPKQPIRYVPPPVKANAPSSPLDNARNKANQNKPLVLSNTKKPIIDVKNKNGSNIKPQPPPNKMNDKQNNVTSQNLNTDVKSNKAALPINKGQINTPKASNQAPSLQANKNETKNTSDGSNKLELNKPKTTVMATQTKIIPKLDNRQSISAIEVKNLTPPRHVQTTATKPQQSQQSTTNNPLQIIPESKIQVQQIFQDTKPNQK